MWITFPSTIYIQHTAFILLHFLSSTLDPRGNPAVHLPLGQRRGKRRRQEDTVGQFALSDLIQCTVMYRKISSPSNQYILCIVLHMLRMQYIEYLNNLQYWPKEHYATETLYPATQCAQINL